MERLFQVRLKNFPVWNNCYNEEEYNMWKGLINPKTNKPFYEARIIEGNEEDYPSTPLRTVKKRFTTRLV